MRRRELLMGISGAVAMPFWSSDRALSAERRIGVLVGLPETNVSVNPRLRALREGLAALGWSEGRDVRFEYRFEPDVKLLQQRAAELVAGGCHIVVAWSTPEVIAATAASKTIPIVFMATADPIGSKIIQSLARPGGNVTGMTNFEPAMGGKWLDLLLDLAPATARIAILTNTDNSAERRMQSAVENAASQRRLAVTIASAQKPDGLEATLKRFSEAPHGGLVVIPGIATNAAQLLIIGLAERLRLPAVYPFRYFAEGGGLVSYGVDNNDLARRAARHVDRILRGAAPSDIPVEGPNRFELVLNQKTVKQLGLTVPQSVLVAADDVIE